MQGKLPFSDKRIGALIAANVKYSIYKDEVNFTEGKSYTWAIDFTVGDEQIVVNNIVLTKKKEK